MSMGDRPRFSVWQDPVGNVQPNLRLPFHYQLNKLPQILLLISILFSLQLLPATPIAQAASGCVTSGPANNSYTITLCFSAPAGSGNLTGNVTVTGSVTTTGTAPGIQRMIFYINGGYLLYDFQSPYTFTLPTTKWIDGPYTLGFSAIMRDGFITSTSTINVRFQNGITKTPVNTNTFTPTGGSQPPPGSPFVVGAVGDGAGGEINATNVTNLIAGWNPNLFLYLGDVYEKGLVTEFYNWYGTSSTFYGRFKSVTNPTIGNHEYENNKAPGYFDYWDNVPNYYSYDAAGWHFISLNSTSQYGQTSTSSAQYSWLSQDLTANASKCTIVYFHHPVFSVGPQGNTTTMTAIWALMAQKGVTIVLTGHDHSYQRWTPLDGAGNPSPTGITQFVVGTGGHAVQNFVRTDNRMVKGYGSAPTAYGAFRLELSSTGAAFKFINTAGTLLDSGTVACSKSGGPVPTNTPTPTATFTPVPQPTATNTPVPAATATNTPVPVATATNTPAPGATATNTPAPGPTATNTPVPPPTATATPLPPTPTPGSGSLTVTAGADTYVNSASPTSNYGSNTALRVDASPDELRSYIKFNVQGLPGPVTKATLRIFANSGSSTGISVRSVADTAWDEMAMTYSSAPAMSTSITGSSGAFTLGTWVSIDITPLVQGNGVVSIAVTTTSSTQINLASRESGANAPQLIINY